ncbi:dolichyl-phosphate-mannose--protein mannosyltransferase [Kibdelosporangium phytohabitans]|uniref:Polyprenol-phosphate-mannose--protein mannosyltransferase n=1 Tax=Kibdelosporangium phytohabitans TaxID=860235 RepID=A0A0N9IHP1_9PSEU|nr:phospholipid carrier-dependent glycosyltransferase [Kibdelosporangium phytohabitans]ALG15002.1 dolichyl-phosphate-mannose-protein mannosyltransferase [Kibdelosporangium phytohabitans]
MADAGLTSPSPSSAADALLGRPMPGDRLRGWLVAAVLAVIGGVVRFQNLGMPTDPRGTPVFDEKYYAANAWQMLRNGWVEDNPGFNLTVHPPLAKQLIALGEMAFGYTGWGWRFASAVAGTLMVLMIVRAGRRLTRSTLLGAVAGVLLICDGVVHLMSRMAMLDIFQAFFVLAAFGCALVDRDQMRQRLAVAVREGWATESGYGPRLGLRWWRFGTGVALGLACGVKWSGLYWVAAFGLLVVFWDVTARRAAGVRHPWLGTLRRDLLPALWSLLIIPVLVYLGTWWAWYASETAVNRHLAEDTGSFTDIVPAALRSLFSYSADVLDFHETLTTPATKPHPWESKPWTWPMGLRPILYFLDTSATGCGEPKCVRATMLIGTPAMWWLALPMLAWGLWRCVARLDWRYAAVLVAYLAGLLPWFINMDRQMYFFYMTPASAFLVLGLVLGLGQVLGAARDSRERRGTGLLVVALYIGLVVANFLWLWPILNGDPITDAHWQAELWLPSWR